jgi:hypothetical protein
MIGYDTVGRQMERTNGIVGVMFPVAENVRLGRLAPVPRLVSIPKLPWDEKMSQSASGDDTIAAHSACGD